jgi:hypothetical protein
VRPPRRAAVSPFKEEHVPLSEADRTVRRWTTENRQRRSRNATLGVPGARPSLAGRSRSAYVTGGLALVSLYVPFQPPEWREWLSAVTAARLARLLVGKLPARGPGRLPLGLGNLDSRIRANGSTALLRPYGYLLDTPYDDPTSARRHAHSLSGVRGADSWKRRCSKEADPIVRPIPRRLARPGRATPRRALGALRSGAWRPVHRLEKEEHQDDDGDD